GVTMYIPAGKPAVVSQGAREGLIQFVTERGATVLSPGCATCWGYLGALGDRDVTNSTQQEHYPGRAGSRKADIYLSSPYVVAASAVAGEITDPRPLLAREGKPHVHS